MRAAMLPCHVTFDCGIRLQLGFCGGSPRGMLWKRNENYIFFFQESGSSKSSGKSLYSIGTDSMHVCLGFLDYTNVVTTKTNFNFLFLCICVFRINRRRPFHQRYVIFLSALTTWYGHHLQENLTKTRRAREHVVRMGASNHGNYKNHGIFWKKERAKNCPKISLLEILSCFNFRMTGKIALNKIWGLDLKYL